MKDLKGARPPGKPGIDPVHIADPCNKVPNDPGIHSGMRRPSGMKTPRRRKGK